MSACIRVYYTIYMHSVLTHLCIMPTHIGACVASIVVVASFIKPRLHSGRVVSGSSSCIQILAYARERVLLGDAVGVVLKVAHCCVALGHRS